MGLNEESTQPLILMRRKPPFATEDLLPLVAVGPILKRGGKQSLLGCHVHI